MRAVPIPDQIGVRTMISLAKTMIPRCDVANRMSAGLMSVLMVAGVCAAQAAAQQADAESAIRAALTKWAADFNSGRTQTVCDLFSRDLRYDYRGHPERNYRDICDLLRRSLADRTKRYAYALAIKEILVSGELAVVRLVWTLTVTKADGSGETVTEEPGMDVFRKQPDGTWKIIRYIAYESPQ
jgi:ketosteroid isomerase-like protein